MSELSGSQKSRPATGRLKTGPAPELVRSANRLEVSHGPVLYRGLSLGDMAHVIVLMETGVIPWASGQGLLDVLLEEVEKYEQEWKSTHEK